MPTTLTTPVIKSATRATVDNWSLSINSRNGGLAPILADTWLNATVVFRDAGGVEISRSSFSVAQTSWGAPLTTNVRTFHAVILTALRNAGLLPAGTDTQDV